MKIDPDAIPDAEQIFLARKLREARDVEHLLTQAGIDYAIEVEAYARSFLFGTIRYGAAFYVASAHAADTRRRLLDAGFGRGIIEEDRNDGTR